MDNFNNEQLRIEKARKKVKAIGGFYKHFIVYVIVNIALLAINYYGKGYDHEFLSFNTFSTPLFWGIGLFFHGLSVFGTPLVFGNNWEERKINEYMQAEKTKKSNWE